MIHFCLKSDFCTALSGIFHSIALFEFILLSMWVIFKHLIVAHLFDGNTITYNIKNYGRRIYVFGIWTIGQYAPGFGISRLKTKNTYLRHGITQFLCSAVMGSLNIHTISALKDKARYSFYVICSPIKYENFYGGYRIYWTTLKSRNVYSS